MKRDFSQLVVDLKGNALRRQLTPERVMQALAGLAPEVLIEVEKALNAASMQPATYASVACDALMAGLEGDARDTLEAKRKRLQLALRLDAGGDQVIGIDEAKEIKDRVNKAFTAALVPARVAEFLEGD